MVDSIRAMLADLGNLVNFNEPWVRAVCTLLVFAALQSVSHRLINRVVERTVRAHKHTSRAEEEKREATLKAFFRTSTSVFLWAVALVLALWQLKLDLSALLTSAGLIGVIAGIGAQSLIKDCLAGVFIILENQLRVGDIVTIASPNATVSGVVEEVTIRTTRLRDLDGNLHIVTNGSIGVITNKSYQFAQINVDINVTYDTPIDTVEDLIKQAGDTVAAMPKYQKDIIEPISMLWVEQLGESTVTLKAFGKVKPGTQWHIAGEFRRQLKSLFEKHKIKAPYQTLVVEEEPAIRKK